MQKISGMVILTGTCWAFSSARWRRLTRISEDWTRSTWAIGMPNASACTMALTKLRISGTLVRSPRPRSAAERPWPICISRSIRENSSASGPSVLWATCWIAASKPRPDSTLMVSRSIASGSSRLHLVRAVVGLLVEVHAGREEAGERAARDDQDADGGRRADHQREQEADRRPRPPARSPCRRRPGRRSSPGGLPARSSLCRIRSPASAPVNRRPIRSAEARSGARTRSENGRSRSLVSSFGAGGHRLEDRERPVEPVRLGVPQGRRDHVDGEEDQRRPHDQQERHLRPPP